MWSKSGAPVSRALPLKVLVKTLEQAGLFDFERLSLESLPSLFRKVDAWPNGMAQTLLLEALELAETDLDFVEREAREKRRQAEIARRTPDRALPSSCVLG
jgi:hypothetical protein